MANVGSLGEYKVVVTADYSQLQSQFQAMNQLVSNTAKSIVDTMNKATQDVNKNMTNGFSNIGVSISKIMVKSLDDTVKGTERKLNELRTKYNDFYKNFPKPPEMPMPKMPNTPSGSSGGGSSRGGNTGFADYAARIRELEKFKQEQMALAQKNLVKREQAEIAQRTAAHKAFWQEQARAEQQAERIQQTNWRNQQMRIRSLQTQYNVLYAEANQYLQTHGKMSEAVFNRLQGKMRAIRAEMTKVYGASPMKTSALEGMKSYEAYASQFGKFGDAIESFKHHLTWLGSAAVIGATFGAPAKLISTITDVEKQMAAMRQVNHDVDKDQRVLNSTMNDFIGIAQKYGHSVDDIIKAGVLWGRGYKDLNTVMKLTNLSAKLGVADNMNVDLANRAVESVINAWQKQGDAINFANHVVDSWTKIAHNAQSSATDLAEALSRTGAAAKAVGVDFDTVNALASSMIKATGRSGAEVGNALKSLFSSIHSKKALAQLQELGVEMYKTDENGQKHFRRLHDVFVDLMITSRTTSRNMEKDLLAISGGRRKLAA
jgi:TP901 family phage tail tape measure protein